MTPWENQDITPKFVKKYGNLAQDALRMLPQYKKEVERGVFPDSDHSFHIQDEVLKAIHESQSISL